MYCCEVLAKSLVKCGIGTMFGVIGEGNLAFVEAYHRDKSTEYVGMSNEGRAVEAAAGLAQTSGNVGSATVTHGPGLTNTVTALTEATRAGIPLILIAADTSRNDEYHAQNIDQKSVVEPTGAGFRQVNTAENVAERVENAIEAAIRERRPIVLNIPSELQWKEVEYLERRVVIEDAQRIRPDTEVLEHAASVIISARRPLVLVGRGVADNGSKSSMVALARRIGAPIATTLGAKDLFYGEPEDVGIFGSLSDRRTMEVISSCDCIIAVGASLNPYTTVKGALLAGKRTIQVDIDPLGAARYPNSAVRVICDGNVFVEEMLSLIEVACIEPSRFASYIVTECKYEQYDAADLNDAGRAKKCNIETALRVINDRFDSERTVVCDGGRFLGAACSYLNVRYPGKLVMSTAFGGIGLGLGTAIGACYGSRDRSVMLVTGDGGYVLGGWSDLTTVVNNQLNLCVVVLNDGAYGAEHVQLLGRGVKPDISEFKWPEFADVADAMGVKGVKVRNVEELVSGVNAIASMAGPRLIDIKLDPYEVPDLGH